VPSPATLTRRPVLPRMVYCISAFTTRTDDGFYYCNPLTHHGLSCHVRRP
jgi:hypothetical protein